MPRPSTPARTRKPSSTPLNRDRILDAAIRLIEQEGAGALSMRRLGSRLDVEAMAIYHHFTSRDELLSAMGDRLLQPLHDLAPADDWRQACRQFATALRNVAVARPASFQLLGLQPLDSLASLRPVESLLTVLVGEGFSPADALAIYRAIVSYARGYALAEATGFTVDAATPAGRRRLAALSPAEFPILAGRTEEMAQVSATSAYDLGLDALLAGLAGP